MTDNGMDDLIRPMLDAAGRMTSRGWCRDTSGNMSMIINDPVEIWDTGTFVFDTGLFLPRLEGRTILMTRSGSRISDIAEEPMENLGIYLIGRDGRFLSLLWGEGAPTSEYLAHLMIYAYAGARTKAVIHSHMDEVERLCSGHFGLPSGLPTWIGWVPPLPPGSIDLALATVQEIERHDIMLWHRHGLVSPGSDLEDGLARLERFREWVDPVLADKG